MPGIPLAVDAQGVGKTAKKAKKKTARKGNSWGLRDQLPGSKRNKRRRGKGDVVKRNGGGGGLWVFGFGCCGSVFSKTISNAGKGNLDSPG